MSVKLPTHLKSLLQALLIFILLSSALDWWRKPTQPLHTTGQTLYLLDNRTIDLDKLGHDQTAILYFWGSWCGVCRHTSPTIEKLHQHGIPVISIALNSGNNQVIQQYLNENKLSFPTVNDSDGLISKTWQVNVTPTIVLIKDGQMVHATTGISTYWGLRLRLLFSRLID